jgi:polyribonucleotide nucleotidyltransferase
MKPTVITKSCTLPDGREITIETGKLARQADGSVVLRMGNTMILATVVANQDPVEGADFLPLSVDYQEKFASRGKIPGGFLKRESRLSDYEILISRLVDRAIRPLFPDDYHAETQVALSLISGDENALPDGLAAFAASSAISVSDIPFNGPISEVRVARINGQFVINPTLAQREQADIDLIVAASIDNILMVEGECKEVGEDDMLDALKRAHEAIKTQCQLQIELTKAVGKEQKRVYEHEQKDEALRDQMNQQLYQKVFAAAALQIPDKHVRSDNFKKIYDEYVATLSEEVLAEKKDLIKKYYKEINKKACRNLALEQGKRLDGRTPREVRPIWSEVNYIPSAHGSAVFTRGETQSLTTVTLGTKLDEQMIDGAMFSGSSKFILHYNFPGFSTGEVKPNRGPGRREVGHGNLALRGLKQVLPTEDNPYTIRIVSDILESNGSSSMATVCAGSLALMDAGIQVKAPVSGIAMGMISDSATKKYAILSDILGDEDHLGDMDFKVVGTEKGITACQMDLKVDGLTYDVLKEALEQAKEGRLHILNEMSKTISKSNTDLKPHTPRAQTIVIEKEMIGAVIGPGGKVVQEIQKTTGATVVIEEVNNKGIVNVFATNKDVMDAAVKRIKAIVAIPEVGTVYDGVVKSIMPFGAFVEFMAGKDGLLHISEIKWERLETMDGVLEVGEEIKVKLIEIDKKTGKFRLSRKAILPKPPRKEDAPVA